MITYYYSKDNGSSYVSSTSNTYTFNGLDMGTEYSFSVYVEDSEGYASKAYTLSETTDDKPPTLADTCRETGSNTLACYVAMQYTTDGENGLYYHDGQGNYTNVDQEAEDNSYRYSGENPNNYVCFGSDATTCPSDNLYRIIGIFNDTEEYRTKLIKKDNYATGSLWSVDQNIVWNSTNKPIVYDSLNNIFNNYISNSWKDLIADNIWMVGEMDYNNLYTVKQFYDMEVKDVPNRYEETMKIGLMYVSDYGYAASPENWNLPLASYSDSLPNWLIYSMTNWVEWTISYNNLNTVFGINSNGNVNIINTYYNMTNLSINRPCFYLNSNVTYVSGSGTESDPIRIN